MKSSFSNIPRKDCKRISLEILKNAESKIKTAEYFCDKSEFGSGISYLIIGSEELTKSLILHLDSLGFNFRTVKGLNNIFKNHQLRYFILFILFSFSVFIDEINEFIQKFNGEKTAIGFMEEFSRRIDKKDKDATSKTMKLIATKLDFLMKEIIWFNKFDKFRQKGFYVDYGEKLESPLNATYKEYLSVKTRVDRVSVVCHELISSYSLENIKHRDSILEQIETMKKENYYTSISSFIKKVKDRKSNPLEFCFQVIQPIIAEFRNQS